MTATLYALWITPTVIGHVRRGRGDQRRTKRLRPHSAGEWGLSRGSLR